MPYFPPAGGGGASFAPPAFTLGTANSEGVATTTVRTDDTLLAFDATVPVTQAFNDAAAAGAAAVAARRDHKHGMPAQDTGWTAMTFQNGWANFGSGFSPGSFRKDADGFVHLRGVLAAGGASGNVVATLPAGYRPGATFSATVSNGGSSFTEVDIATSGTITLGGHAFGPSLDGIAFLAEN